MRSRIPHTLTTLLLGMALLVAIGPVASAQDITEVESQADAAEKRAQVASGLVDEAVADRAVIEVELTASITRANDLAATLSQVGSGLDRLAEQLGFADIELAGIKAQIEVQAVDAYMSVVASPSLSFMATGSVEQALVASTVVEDVVSGNRQKVDELFIKRRSLEELQQVFLSQEAEYAALQAEVDAEVEHLASLYEQADAAVADAVRRAQAADQEHRAALGAVDMARARDAERERQENREPTTTTAPPGTSPSTTKPTTTTSPGTPTTTGGGDGNVPTSFPPHIEQWRSLVEQFFPANRVNEALAILRCESNGDPDAYNPYSGASGLFQFLPSTWASTAPKAGYAGASVFDPEANAASAAWLANRYQQLGQYYWQAWSCRRVLN
ncbi:MAG: transglycosylase SLT domain-containing protein [Acidimicrobiia bacterium]